MRKGKGIAYEDEGPGNIVSFFMQVMSEKDQNARDDNGGDELAESQ